MEHPRKARRAPRPVVRPWPGPRLAAAPFVVAIAIAFAAGGALAAGTGTAPGAGAGAAASAAGPAAGCPPLLASTQPRLQDDVAQPLCQYRGRVLLVVNTASYCGFTEQYRALEALHSRYQARGFTVLGFPSNDFGQQEPGNRQQIAELCFNTYGVRFPMFAKSVVTGPQANPLFAALARDTGSPPRWNFHKYLVDREGRAVQAFPSAVDPLDPRIAREIERLLQGAGTIAPASSTNRRTGASG